MQIDNTLIYANYNKNSICMHLYLGILPDWWLAELGNIGSNVNISKKEGEVSIVVAGEACPIIEF